MTLRLKSSVKETRYLSDALHSGYLRDLELAFQRGTLDDYALFPATQLRRGVAPLRADPLHHANDRTLSDWFKAWEEAQGVLHQDQRGHRGLRRTYTDIAQAIGGRLGVSDLPRVLDLMTGHDAAADDSTRQRVYVHKHSPDLLEAGRRIRDDAGWFPVIGDLDADGMRIRFGGGLPEELREQWDDWDGLLHGV